MGGVLPLFPVCTGAAHPISAISKSVVNYLNYADERSNMLTSSFFLGALVLLGPAGPGISFLTRLTLLREVNFDLKTMDLVSNPAPELTSLRTGSLATEKAIALEPNSTEKCYPTSI